MNYQFAKHIITMMLTYSTKKVTCEAKGGSCLERKVTSFLHQKLFVDILRETGYDSSLYFMKRGRTEIRNRISYVCMCKVTLR